MAGENQDPYDVLGRPASPIVNPQFRPPDPFGAGQMAPGGLGMQLALYAPQFLQRVMGLGSDKFIPEQAPAMMLLDQMAASKYGRDVMASRENMRHIDQSAIYSRMNGVAERFGIAPTTPIGQGQLNNFAKIASTDEAQSVVGMFAGGPQNVEDLFFGRRGSAVQFAGAVGQFGFYRPDSVTGARRLSGEGLKQFTEQLHSNLYGPNADLTDVSGFSAGRTGALANELARRGMLPQGIGRLPAQERMEVLRNKDFRPPDFEESLARDLADEEYRGSDRKFAGYGDKTYAQLDRASQLKILTASAAEPEYAKFQARAGAVSAAMDDKNTEFEKLAEMPGGAAGIRKVDATRAGQAIKEYTGVIDAVRTIFGDNGMGNAPMQQLIAGLDALSQGGSATMSTTRLENVMRRTQMAAKDTGVNLEALMGLTARGGALADQQGLSREAVPEAVISAMERTSAMRDTDSFRAGFGKMDIQQATLYALDQTVRSDASNASRLAAVAHRIVKENAGNSAFMDPDKNPGAQALIRFADAYEKGRDTFIGADGKAVNIAKALGEDPVGLISQLTKPAGITDEEIEARIHDPTNTQEYLRSGRLAGAQRYEAIQGLTASAAEEFMLRGRANGVVPEDQQVSLATSMGESLTTAMIDEVDNSMTPQARIAVLQRAARRGVERHVRQQAKQNNENLTEKQIQDRTKDLFIGQNGLFKTDDEALKYAGVMQARIATQFKGQFGSEIVPFRQENALRVLTQQQINEQRNAALAELASTIPMTGDGSNFFQRFSDALAQGKDAAGLLATSLGVVDTAEHQQRIMDAVGGPDTFKKAMGTIAKTFKDTTVDDPAEKTAAMAQVFSAKDADKAAAFSLFKSRFDNTPGMQSSLFGDYTSGISSAQIATNVGKIKQKDDRDRVRGIMKQLYLTKHADRDAKEVEAEFDKDETGKITELAGMLGFRQAFAEYAGEDAADLMSKFGLDDKTMSEAEMGVALETMHGLAGANPAELRANKEKRALQSKLIREMGAGNISADTILTTAGIDTTSAEGKKISGAITDAFTQLTDGMGDKSESLGKLNKLINDPSLGLSQEQRDTITGLTGIGRGQRITGGGFDAHSPEAIAAGIRKTTRTAELLASVTDPAKANVALNPDIKKLADEVNALPVNDPQRTKKQEELDTALAAAGVDVNAATPEEFAKGLQGIGIAADEAKKIATSAQKAIDTGTAATAGGDAAGGLADLISGLGAGLGDQITKIIGDKLQNIDKIEVQNINLAKADITLNAGDLVSALTKGFSSGGAAAAAAPVAAPAGQPAPAASGAAGTTAPGQASTQGGAADQAKASSPPGQPDAAAGQTLLQSVAQLVQVIPQLTQMRGQSGDGAKELTVSGKLELQGLAEVIANLNFGGGVPSPDGGPTIPTGPAGSGRG